MTEALSQTYIKAFFDYLEDRVNYLVGLYASGRQDEAVTLCCVYIDGISNSMWPNGGSKRNFVRALVELSEEPQMRLYHPRALLRWLESAARKFAVLASQIETGFTPIDQPMEEEPFRNKVEVCLGPEGFRLVEKELWRATIAAITYQRVRIPWIHRLQGYGAVSFGNSSYGGAPLADIDFEMLHRALVHITAAARQTSEQSGKFFGHDFAPVNAGANDARS